LALPPSPGRFSPASMAKRKRRGGPGGGGPTGADAGAGGANAAAVPTSRVRSGGYCARSSLGTPFLVVAREQLVKEVPAPGPEDLRELLELVGDLVKMWEARGAVVLADFEGAFMGFEGEPLTAAFQRTLALDPKSLRPLPGGGPSKEMGLLVDLRSEEGAACTKRIMESESVVKVVWGADNDVVSLRYTPVARPLGICSTRVVDAQLGFSDPHRRLKMGKMLQRLPPKSVEGLAEKAALDFNGAHAFNRFAFHLPLEPKEVTYALDDIHRVEAILRNQSPRGGSYLQAQSVSSTIVSLILRNPASASATKLRQYQEELGKRSGLERQETAVRIKRHLMTVRKVLSPDSGAEFAGAEQEAEAILQQAGVRIPDDLSFAPAGDGDEAPAAEATLSKPEEAAPAPQGAGAEKAAEGPVGKEGVEEAVAPKIQEPAMKEADGEKAEEEAEAPPAKAARKEAQAAEAEKPAALEAGEEEPERAAEEPEQAVQQAAEAEEPEQQQEQEEVEAPKRAAKRKGKKRRSSGTAAPDPEAPAATEDPQEAAGAPAEDPPEAAEAPAEEQEAKAKRRKKRRSKGAAAEAA